MPKAIYTTRLLQMLSKDGPNIQRTFYYHYPSLRLFRKLTKAAYWSIVSQMEKSGRIEIVEKNNQKFIKITAKGELELFIYKAKLPGKGKWDGKWRLVIFDIPEKSRLQRDLLRRLLKANGYYKLQASVFISPYPINMEALAYLKKSGLIGFIRVLRVDEIDDATILKKHFKL